MARWVQLTADDGNKTPLVINLEQITYLRPREPGARIYFIGGDYTDVAEEPLDVLIAKPIL